MVIVYREEGQGDQVKEVNEEGTSDEKQKLTEAEEKPAADKDEKMEGMVFVPSVLPCDVFYFSPLVLKPTLPKIPDTKLFYSLKHIKNALIW